MPHPLSTTSLTVGYTLPKGEVKRVLLNVDVHLEYGEIVFLVGGNGVGKSTLLRTLCGEQPPLVGTVLLHGDDLQWLDKKDVSKTVAYVPAWPEIPAGTTVEDFVAQGREPFTGFLGMMNDDDRRLVADAIFALRLAGKEASPMGHLSDSERRRVLLARALAQDAHILLLDEPFAMLDSKSAVDVMEILDTLAHKKGRSVVVAMSNPGDVLSKADRIWTIRPESQTVEDGKKDDRLRVLKNS